MIYELRDMSEIEMYAVYTQCYKSYLYYHDHRWYKRYVDYLLDKVGTKRSTEKAVRWFVSNTALALRKNARGFRMSFDKNVYSEGDQKIGYTGVFKLVKWLEENSYIHVYKGFVKEWSTDGSPEKTIQSCVVFRERWLDMWKGEKYTYNLWKELDEQDLVVIRDRETKEAKPTRGHVGVKEVRKGMQTYNDSLVGADITFDGKPIADVVFSRIFSDDVDHGGRLYVCGGGVQTIPSSLRRSKILIDGEPVVEVDFCAIHPSICYQLLHNSGESVYDILGNDFSPYAADLSFIGVNQHLKGQWELITGREHNPLRKLAKLAILIGMNAKDEQSAVCALSSKILSDRKKKNIADQEFYAIDSSIPVKQVYDAVREHNSFIADQFFSDAGMWLQNTDSKIMMDVVSTMIQKGHTVLGYHDSALVKQSACEDLKLAMIGAWKRVLCDTTYCKIEEKVQ